MKGITVLFLAFDGIVHVINPQFVIDSFTSLGYDASLAVLLGIIELVFLVLYILPRTTVLGALFLTGYLGGAVATHVIAQSDLFGSILFPIYIAVFMWGGVYLLNPLFRSVLCRK